MKPLFLLAGIALSSPSFSACYVAENFQGRSAAKGNDYGIEDSGALVDGPLQITIEGENASVSPSDLTCSSISETQILCLGGNSTQITTVEAWAIDLLKRKVIYTQVRNGMTPPFDVLDGGKVMIGELTQFCD